MTNLKTKLVIEVGNLEAEKRTIGKKSGSKSLKWEQHTEQGIQRRGYSMNCYIW